MAFDVSDTIAAIASARGGAARGIVRISGPNTFHCVASRWAGPSAAIERVGTARCVSGEWRLPHERRLPCQIYLWPNERSYTRQPTAEIHTLGCDPILDILLGQVCQSGARLANAGEFTLRAFLAGRLDLPQAEAVLGVIDSDNQQQLSIALGQLAGGLSKPLNQLRNQLLDLCADVEAGLDFVDEHIEFVSPEDIIRTLDRILNALIELRTQIGSRSLSAAIPKALICGRPNVGKSSLWNALLRNSGESAIVSDIAGTTRDFLEATLGLEGTSCVLVDTAGLDEQLASLVDRESQRLSHAAIDRADCVVLCLDGSRSLHDWEVKGLQSSTYDLVVVNKVDLPTQSFLASLKTATNQIATTPWGWTISDATANRSIELLAVSAEAKQGLDQIRKRLNRHFQELSPDELKVCGSTAARCQSCVERSITAVRRAQQVTAADVGQELLAAELREALDGLAEVAGEVYTDDILDRVFSRFCIGK